MQCPKCKAELENNILKCPSCGVKVASVCKDCGEINPITAFECSNCHKILLKKCDECSAINVGEAKVCRKCGKEFPAPKKLTQPEYRAQTNSQQKVKSLLIDAVKDGNKTIITLSGESGSGKNLVLRYAIEELKNTNIVWLFGSCTQLTQLSPFGYFQDVLLSFFNVNNFCPDTLQLKKNSVKFFKQDFPSLTNSEILDLLNFLYPENLDKYENIYQNKVKMFIVMKKVIMTIIEKVKAVFIIDNFDNIDSMSFDFLKELLKDNNILERCKFIITSQIAKPGMGYITSPLLTEENYEDLSLAQFTGSQIQALLSQYKDLAIDEDYLKNTIKISDGSPAIAEQMVMLYKDLVRNNLMNKISPNNQENLISARLKILRQEDYRSYRMLTAMSVLGVKFYPAMLEQFDNNSSDEFERIIDSLVNKGFINQINSLSFEFKSQSIWKIIVSIVKNDSEFEEILNILNDIIGIYKQSSIALLGYIVQKLNNNDEAFEIWTLLMKHASYIGDIGLYIISQKQALKLIEHKTSAYYQKIKKNIYTRVGKLLEPIDHNQAFEYLQNAILMIEDNEENEHIDLLGYIASSSMKSGNYCGVIECVDNVVSKIPEEMELQKALIKSRKVRPLLRLGNYGQLINLVDNEVMPILEKYLARGKNTPVISIKELYLLWIEIYFDFAESLTFQGDSRMFDIIKVIFEIIEKNKITDTAILAKSHLALALANTIKGDINTSEKILDDILKEYSLDSMDPFIISRWNFIDILNKFLIKDYDSLYTELFNVVSYANNVNDNFTKNILKTFLAKIFKDKNNTKKALEILEEQVSYFAKEKVATGVLFAWYLIAEIKLETSGTQFALDIASKALDIAQGPNINNYYFIALFNKLIGEIYISKQDFDSAKVYLEKSIFVAKQFNLQYILVKDYIQYAKFYQELALPKSTLRGNYIKQALKMFQYAKNTEIVKDHPSFDKEIKKELSVLTSFCKLNGIMLKKAEE